MDPLSRSIHDPLHSDEEERFVLMGQTHIGVDMNKPITNDPDLLEEYDFSKSEVGRYEKRYANGTNVVVLEPDVAAVFKNAEAVNKVLREHINKRGGA